MNSCHVILASCSYLCFVVHHVVCSVNESRPFSSLLLSLRLHLRQHAQRLVPSLGRIHENPAVEGGGEEEEEEGWEM